MNYIWMAIKGLFIGISNIIPGLSGGTMAVSFGIYDDVIHAVTHLKKEWKSSLKVLVPLGVGVLLGTAGFSHVIEFLLLEYTLITALSFIGLILGGIPILWGEFEQSLNKEKTSINYIHWIVFILMFVLIAWMGIMDISSDGAAEAVEISFRPLFALFIVGAISAAAMVIPGVSGSLLMLIIGYYYVFLYVINGFTTALQTLNIADLWHFGILAFAFGLGMIIGILLISKVIDFFFKHFPTYTYAGIFGLVLSSPIAIIVNTDAFTQIAEGDFISILIAIIIGVVCFFITYLIGQTGDETKEDTQ